MATDQISASEWHVLWILYFGVSTFMYMYMYYVSSCVCACAVTVLLNNEMGDNVSLGYV